MRIVTRQRNYVIKTVKGGVSRPILLQKVTFGVIKMTISYKLRGLWNWWSKNKASAIRVKSQSRAASLREFDDIEGAVQLKNGETLQVKLNDLKQFIDNNRDQIAIQKNPNMGKRRS